MMDTKHIKKVLATFGLAGLIGGGRALASWVLLWMKWH
ncbi:MAG: selenobiotic family radical SAM modification target peptide [Deltaproteobacteria bacterium]|nr:selenobiotic family radical SAM modification target peptide [Deltaproteobacteria bacterium]